MEKLLRWAFSILQRPAFAHGTVLPVAKCHLRDMSTELCACYARLPRLRFLRFLRFVFVSSASRLPKRHTVDPLISKIRHRLRHRRFFQVDFTKTLRVLFTKFTHSYGDLSDWSDF